MANSKPAAVRRWQTEVISVKSTACYIATALGLRPGDLLAEIDWRKQVEKMICSMKPPQATEAYGNHSKK
jgi:hypothetical protein